MLGVAWVPAQRQECGVLGDALIAAAAGIVIVALSVGTDLAIRYFLMTPLPVLVVVRLVLLSRETEDGDTEWYPLGRVMGWLSAIGVGALVAATIYYLGSPGGLEGVVKTSLSAAVQQMPEQLRAPMQSFVDAIARYYPGIMIALTVITAMVNGVFAQWMAVQFGRNIRPTPAYSAVAAPEWMAIALALAGAERPVPPVVPEPASALLMAIGLVTLLSRKRG